MPTVRGMRVRFGLVIAMAAVAGCGDDVPPQAVLTGGNGGASSAGNGGAGGGGDGNGGANAGRGGAGGAPSGTAGSSGSGASAGGAGSGGGAAGSGGGAGSSAGGAGGFPATPGFTGCSHVGGVDRIVLSKQDTARAALFEIGLLLNNQPQPAGLTLPSGWNVSAATVRSCAGNGASTVASQIAGSISWPPQIGFSLPTSANLDVTLTFPGNDGGAPSTEMLVGQNIDIRMACGLGRQAPAATAVVAPPQRRGGCGDSSGSRSKIRAMGYDDDYPRRGRPVLAAFLTSLITTVAAFVALTAADRRGMLGFLRPAARDVEVPALAGTTVEQARDLLQARHLLLRLEAERPDATVPAGKIAGQCLPLRRLAHARGPRSRRLSPAAPARCARAGLGPEQYGTADEAFESAPRAQSWYRSPSARRRARRRLRGCSHRGDAARANPSDPTPASRSSSRPGPARRLSPRCSASVQSKAKKTLGDAGFKVGTRVRLQRQLRRQSDLK